MMKILLVDDDEIFREAFLLILEASGMSGMNDLVGTLRV